MPIRVVHKEIEVGALVDESFPKLTPKNREKVIAALIKANPALEGGGKVDAGTVINVPAVVGVKARPKSDTQDSLDPVDDGREIIMRAVKDYGAQLARRHELYQEQLKADAALLKDSELKKALRDRLDAAELVPGIDAAIKARTKEAATLQKEFDDAVKKLGEALASL